jgi:hypothetical protein
MFRKEQPVSHDDQANRQQAPNEMRVLTPEELREVVGGPEVNNGGGGFGIVANVTSSSVG